MYALIYSISSVYKLVEERGRKLTLVTRKFAGVQVPASETKKDVFVYENFAEFTIEETGEKGVGIDESFFNPYLEH